MDLNTLFFMRPSLHGMMYPAAFGPREYLLLRGKLPISPPPPPPPTSMGMGTIPFIGAHRPVQQLSQPQDLSPRKRVSPGSPQSVPHGGHHPLAIHHPQCSTASMPVARSPDAAVHHPHPNQQQPDQYGPIKRLAQVQPPRNPNKPLTSFSIADILDAAPKQRPTVVRPWGRDEEQEARDLRDLQDDDREDSESRCSRDDGGNTSGEDGGDEEIDVEEQPAPGHKKGVSPLDALFKMTSKTFDGNDPRSGHPDADGTGRDHLSLFTKSQPPKKRRKSRTAFTNQQIYELEKRFLYQKYLTPADKEEIALTLGLSNAQVITWFQNRRAKLKRDLEELKADVTAAKIVSSGGEEDNSEPPSFTSLEELQLYNKSALKKAAASQQTPPQLLHPPQQTVPGAAGGDESRDSLESTDAHPAHQRQISISNPDTVVPNSSSVPPTSVPQRRSDSVH